MPIVLIALLLCILLPGAAHAGPVFFAALSAGAGVGSAFAATALGGFLTSTVGRILMSVALSALQAALQEKPKAPGIVTEATLTGSKNPMSFIIGRYATAGTLHGPMRSHGKVSGIPNAYRNYIVLLSAIPGAQLSRLMINGEYVELGSPPHADYGLPVLGRFEGYAWVKYYDGTQTAADPMLLAKYADDPDRPWTADMVGTGLCYAILTFRFSQKVWTSGEPGYRFEMDSIPLYDPRLDSTVGGSGPQRWTDRSTWSGSNNPIVQAYNIYRGIEIPDLGVWGGKMPAADLPLSEWFAAMNICDQTVTRPGGAVEPRYRTGYEITVDTDPADVIEELFKAAATRIAEVGGLWKPRTGGPGLPVWFMTDDDIIVTSPQDLDPFPGADQRHNGISTSGPNPDAVWEAEPDREIYNAEWEAEDGDKRLVASLNLRACPYPLQRQRVGRAYIKDERRFRRHQQTLPPDAAILEPLDTLGWTSSRNGYATKHFEVGEMQDDVLSIQQTVSMREVDPTDYADPPEYGEITAPVPTTRRPVPAQTLSGFDVLAGSTVDAAGNPRRPHLVFVWDGEDQDGVTGIEWEVRLSASGVHVSRGSTTNVEAGRLEVFDGILPGTAYQGRGRQIAPWPVAWTDWVVVDSSTARLTTDDLVQSIGDAIADAQALRAEYDLLTAGYENTIAEGLADAAALAVAGLDGWLVDPTFRGWVAGNLDPANWAIRGGTSAYASLGGGHFGGGMLVSAPAGTASVDVAATSVTGMAGADATTDYVVLTLHVDYLAGDPAGARAFVEWSNDGVTWTRGNAFGETASQGFFASYGLAPKPGVRQAVQTLWARPAGVSGHIRARLVPKLSGVAAAQQMRVHLFNTGPASQAQIDAGRTYSVASATPGQAVSVAGIGAAMAQINDAVTARVGGVEAAVTTTQTAVVANGTAIANLTNTISVQGDGQVFRDVFNSLAGWEVWDSTGEITLVSSPVGIGGKILRLGNNVDNDHVRITHKTLIPYDPEKTYKTTVRLRRLVGAGTVYVGFVGVAEDGVTLVNVNGDNALYSQHYHVLAAAAPGSGYADYTGYTAGHATPGDVGIGTKSAPGKVHSGVRFLRPLILANTPSGTAGIVDLVHFTVSDAVTADLPAEVTTQAAVIGGMTGASMYMIRAINSGGTAVAEFVSPGDPNGPPAAITLEAPNLFMRAEQLLLETSNRFPDPDMMRTEFYSTPSAAEYTFLGTNTAGLGRKYLSLEPSAAYETVYSGWFSVEPSTEYMVRGAAWLATATAGSGTCWLWIETGSVDGAGVVTPLTLTTIKSVTDAVYNPASSFGSVVVTTDAAARRARFRVSRPGGGTAAARSGGYSVEKRIGASLILDGTLQALAAQIATAWITEAHLGNAIISTAKIKTAAITKDLVVNGAVSKTYGKKKTGSPQTITATAWPGTLVIPAFSVDFETDPNGNNPVMVTISGRARAASPAALLFTVQGLIVDSWQSLDIGEPYHRFVTTSTETVWFSFTKIYDYYDPAAYTQVRLGVRKASGGPDVDLDYLYLAMQQVFR